MGYFTLRQRRIVDEDGEDVDVFQFSTDDDAVIDLPWLRGIRFKQPPAQPIVLRFEDDAPDDAAFVDYLSRPIPLVSYRLKEVLERAGTSNVEFFDVRVEGAEAYEDFPGYVAINIVGKVEVADPSLSRSTRAFGVMGADLFDKFVPRTDLKSNLVVFRMAERVSTLVVSARIPPLCDELGVDTIDFVLLAATGG